MNQDKLSATDVERLIAELAPPARQEVRKRARRERLRESTRRAAREEIRRVFRRLLLRRLAGSAAAILLLVGALDHMSLVLWDIMHPPIAGAEQEAPGIMLASTPAPPAQFTSLAEDVAAEDAPDSSPADEEQP